VFEGQYKRHNNHLRQVLKDTGGDMRILILKIFRCTWRIKVRRLLFWLILSLLNASPVIADDKYVTASIGFYDTRAIFRIPESYKPEVYETFFRIIVDYPSMRATVGSRTPPINRDSLDIVVHGYPKYGTAADQVVLGTEGAQLIGRENGYAVYIQPLNRNHDIRILGFSDLKGNNVTVEILPDPFIRNVINHGISPDYEIRFSVDKSIKADYRDIDRAVKQLIAEMFVATHK
jgi:hypothetical protein